MNRIILLSLLSCLAFTPARAEVKCDTALADWQPVANLVAAAEKLGWTVTKVRADDGCYHVRATDKDGKNVQAEFDPQTLKLLERSDEDKKGQRDHEKSAKGSSD